MLVESLLAYAHFVAILSLVVFLTSEAALCRPDVQRLARVDMIYAASAVAVLLTGVARTVWGLKGAGWYWSQPLLHIKFTLFVVIGLMSIKPTLTFIRWKKALAANGSLPSEAEVRQTRRLVMVQAHLIVLIPLAAVMLARGVWVK